MHALNGWERACIEMDELNFSTNCTRMPSSASSTLNTPSLYPLISFNVSTQLHLRLSLVVSKYIINYVSLVNCYFFAFSMGFPSFAFGYSTVVSYNDLFLGHDIVFKNKVF